MSLAGSKRAPKAGCPQRTDSRQGHSVSGHANNYRKNSDVLVNGEEFLNGIIEETKKVERERDEKLRSLMNRLETFMKKLPKQNTDGLSQQLKFRATTLREDLHKKLLKPVEYQDETGFDMHGRDEFCSDAINKTHLLNQDEIGFDSHKRAHVYTDAINKTYLLNQDEIAFDSHKRAHVYTDVINKTHLLNQDEIGFDSHKRAHVYSDAINKTPLLSQDEIGFDSHKRAHVYSDAINKTPLLSQDEIGFDSHKRAQVYSDAINKTPASCANVVVKSGQAHAHSRNLPLKSTKQNGLEAAAPPAVCLLLGSTGNGKSSTGNSILGKDEFRVSSSVNSSSTPNIAMGSTEIGGRAIRVVDGPSIHDSTVADHDFMERIIIAMEQSLGLCDYAFSAIVIVLRFGSRFTKQEAETIKLIKSVLGKNVIKDFGICAITHGDNFLHAVEDAAEEGQVLTFEGWCREQTGEVKFLFEECGFRCVLFDNKTKDEQKKRAQRQALLNVVNPSKTYSKEEFLQAEEGLKELLDTEAVVLDLEQQTQNLLDKASHDMLQISDYDSDEYNEGLGTLLRQLIDHQDGLHELGLSSPKLRQLLLSLKVLENDIRSKISQRKQIENNLDVSLLSEYGVSSPLGNGLHSEGWTNVEKVECEDTNRIIMSCDNVFIDPLDSKKRPTVPGQKATIRFGVKKKWKKVIKYIRLSKNSKRTHFSHNKSRIV